MPVTCKSWSDCVLENRFIFVQLMDFNSSQNWSLWLPPKHHRSRRRRLLEQLVRVCGQFPGLSRTSIQSNQQQWASLRFLFHFLAKNYVWNRQDWKQQESWAQLLTGGVELCILKKISSNQKKGLNSIEMRRENLWNVLKWSSPLATPEDGHIGQFLQGGKNGRLMSFFLK